MLNYKWVCCTNETIGGKVNIQDDLIQVYWQTYTLTNTIDGIFIFCNYWPNGWQNLCGPVKYLCSCIHVFSRERSDARATSAEMRILRVPIEEMNIFRLLSREIDDGRAPHGEIGVVRVPIREMGDVRVSSGEMGLVRIVRVPIREMSIFRVPSGEVSVVRVPSGEMEVVRAPSGGIGDGRVPSGEVSCVCSSSGTTSSRTFMMWQAEQHWMFQVVFLQYLREFKRYKNVTYMSI